MPFQWQPSNPELRAVRQHLHVPGHRLRALHRLGHPAGDAPHHRPARGRGGGTVPSPGGPARPGAPCPRQGDDRPVPRPRRHLHRGRTPPTTSCSNARTSSSTWPTSPTSKPPSRPCSRWSSTTDMSCSRAETSGSAPCCCGTSSRRSNTAARRCSSTTTSPPIPGTESAKHPRSSTMSPHLQARPRRVRGHVPLEDRLISTKAVGPSGLYLSELRDRLPLGRPPTAASMLSHVPGRDLRTMLWRETQAQTPRHDPAHEPLPTWVERLARGLRLRRRHNHLRRSPVLGRERIRKWTSGSATDRFPDQPGSPRWKET